MFYDKNIEVTSCILGCYNNQLFKIDYNVILNHLWETQYVSIGVELDNTQQIFEAEKTNGGWLINGKQSNDFNSAIDIDISLTPFTNTLPINRLKLKDNQQTTIEVLYFDLLERKTHVMKQQYTRLDKTHYLYENYDKRFKAEVEIDDSGFVKNYPELFKMNCKKQV